MNVDLKVLRGVVFAILMENNQGVMGKAPSYVDEKMARVFSSNDPIGLLDRPNQNKLLDWASHWNVDLPARPSE